MEKTKQKIFKSSYLSDLRTAVRSGGTLLEYYSGSFTPPDGSEWQSAIDVFPEKLELVIGKAGSDQTVYDLENAMRVHVAFPGLDEVQASDPRLWAHLAHVDLRKYALARWGLKQSKEDIKKDAPRASAINFILEHWFASGADRSLRRHAIARLWWAAHLTASPWERNPEFFGSIEGKEDAYALTRVVFATQDIFQQVLERSIGRDNKILVAVLDCIRDRMKADMLPTREQIRAVMKELNLISSVRNLSVLAWPELKEAVDELFIEAGSNVAEARRMPKKRTSKSRSAKR